MRASSTAYGCARPPGRYVNRDMADLEAKLQDSQGARHRLIATDGVFSMDGYVAPRRHRGTCRAHGALVMVDDSHAVGFVGPTGAGRLSCSVSRIASIL